MTACPYHVCVLLHPRHNQPRRPKKNGNQELRLDIDTL